MSEIKAYASHNIEEIIEAIKLKNTGLMIFFYGADNDYKQLDSKIASHNIPYVGCMDAGRLITGKYLLDEKSIVGLSLPTAIIANVVVDTVDMSAQRDYDAMCNDSHDKLVKAAESIGIDLAKPDMEREFAINLLYGLNSANAFLAGQSKAGLMLQTAGGSSGGKTDFKVTNVISSAGSGKLGAFALVKLSKDYKFLLDRISSFDTVENVILNVTKLADPRHILELNNKPATEAYCEAVGIREDELNPDTFANYTLGIEPGDEERLITSIMTKDEGSGLLTYNDVVPGAQFQLYKAKSQQQDRSRGLGKLKGRHIVSFLSFDCILCYLARNTLHEVQAIADVYEEALPGVPKIGFGTFSENICGANVNQTETFLAIYKV
ncbi:MAG: FIST C-terminal domain-containing protein [Spirochaetales bacterium]|nr:FIST C-terminal domain-containing protein [Spirochaetales bacterium]